VIRYGDSTSIEWRAAPMASRYNSFNSLAPLCGALQTTIERFRSCRRRKTRLHLGINDSAGHDPVLVEGRFDVGDRGSVDLDLRVAPHREVLHIVRPLVRDAHAADKRDLAVDDERLAMSSVIDLFELKTCERIYPADARPGVLEPFDVFLRHFLGTDRVQHQPHLDAPASGCLERVRESRADHALFVDVTFEPTRSFACSMAAIITGNA
jgi:hypothetical protein